MNCSRPMAVTALDTLAIPPGRDVMAAADRLMQADDAELMTIVRHDPDMIRHVAAALIHERKSTA